MCVCVCVCVCVTGPLPCCPTSVRTAKDTLGAVRVSVFELHPTLATAKAKPSKWDVGGTRGHVVLRLRHRANATESANKKFSAWPTLVTIVAIRTGNSNAPRGNKAYYIIGRRSKILHAMSGNRWPESQKRYCTTTLIALMPNLRHRGRRSERSPPNPPNNLRCSFAVGSDRIDGFMIAAIAE